MIWMIHRFIRLYELDVSLRKDPAICLLEIPRGFFRRKVRGCSSLPMDIIESALWQEAPDIALRSILLLFWGGRPPQDPFILGRVCLTAAAKSHLSLCQIGSSGRHMQLKERSCDEGFRLYH